MLYACERYLNLPHSNVNNDFETNIFKSKVSCVFLELSHHLQHKFSSSRITPQAESDTPLCVAGIVIFVK